MRETVAEHPFAVLVVGAPKPEVRRPDDAIGHAAASGYLLHAVGAPRMELES